MSDMTASSGSRRIEPVEAQDGAAGGIGRHLPAGWWLVPAILIGSGIWAMIFIAVIRALI